jgi:hypothetical protein
VRIAEDNKFFSFDNTGSAESGGKKGRVYFRVLTPSSEETMAAKPSLASRAPSIPTKTKSSKSYFSRITRKSLYGDVRIDDEQLTLGSADDGRVHVVWLINTTEVQKRFEEEYVPSLLEGGRISELFADDGVESKPAGHDEIFGLSVCEKDVENTGSVSLQTISVVDGDGVILEHRDDAENSDENIYSSDVDIDVLVERARILRGASNDRTTISQEETSLQRTNSHLFIEQGTRIEYFSSSHKRWLAATMHIEIGHRGGGQVEQAVIYNAVIAHGTSHPNVPVDCVRRLFAPGDLVEVYSHRHGGEWLAAQVFGAQGAIPTSMGYTVRLADTEQVLENIPAARLRLRFPPGLQVRVFRDSYSGWIDGIVDATAPKDGIGAKSIHIGSDSGATQLSVHERNSAGVIIEAEAMIGSLRETMRKNFRKTHSFATSPTSPTRGMPRVMSRSMSRSHSEAMLVRDLAPWVEVPVICAGSCNVEMFPSYRLRQVSVLQPSRKKSLVLV